MVVDLVGIEPTTSPAGRGALVYLSDVNRSIFVLIYAISSSSIGTRGDVLPQSY